jgi:hypothetical protein
MKEHIWHRGSQHVGALRLAKSDGILAEPAKWRTDIWYLLTMDKNDVIRGLAENSPRHSLSIAWTQGLLSVKTHV